MPNSIYLGHLLIFNHNDRTKAYDFIINKFRAKLTNLKAHKLNHAGILAYINSVLASIPIYYMSTILFSKEFISKITSIIRKFWWTGVQEENATSSFHFRSWNDICRPKKEGSLGVRDLLTVNRSLLLNAASKIAIGKNAFLTDILKSKYHPNSSFWLAGNCSTKSAFWSSIMSVKDILINNCTIQIQKGNSSIWFTPWCIIWKQIHSHLKWPITVQSLPNNISDLWNPGTINWNSDLISQIFDRQAIQAIQEIIIVPSSNNDTVKWEPSSKGDCSTKDAFSFLNNQMQVHPPPQGSRSISRGAMHILQRVWENKLIPPNIKTFAWRLIRKALATGERAGSWTNKIDKNCAYCGMNENDSHLFFHCNFARVVWFSAKPPFRSSLLPFERDGVQEALEILITHATSEDIMLKILTTLWFIWKDRNDIRFRQRKWSVLQVHYAAQAYINKVVSASNEEHRQKEAKGIDIDTPQVRNLYHAGNTQEEIILAPHMSHLAISPDRSCLYTTHRLPTLLPGVKCYTDATLAPDNGTEQQRKAELGIFILNPKRKEKFFIKAHLLRCGSVLMAEAAVLALAADITSRLWINKITFLTDFFR